MNAGGRFINWIQSTILAYRRRRAIKSYARLLDADAKKTSFWAGML